MLDEFLFLSSAHILDGAVPPAGKGEEYALVFYQVARIFWYRIGQTANMSVEPSMI